MQYNTPTVSYKSEHPFLFFCYKYLSIVIFLSLIILISVDFLEYFGFPLPNIRAIVRGGSMVIFFIALIDLSTISVGPTHFLFPAYVPYLLMMFLYALLESSMYDGIYYVSRVMYWTIGSLFIYRMLIIKAITIKTIRFFIYWVSIMYFMVTIYAFFFSTLKFDQNIKIYTMLWCIPIFFLLPQTWFRNLIIALSYFTVFISFKRGAMLALFLSSLVAIITETLIRKQFKFTFKATCLCLSLFLLVSFSLLSVYSNRPEYFEKRISDIDDNKKLGSGRASFYPFLINKYLDSFKSSPVNFFFGNGSRSVQKFMLKKMGIGIYAHSDWLQIMYDYGVIGLLVFFFGFHFLILKALLKAYKQKYKYTSMLTMTYVNFSLANIYSGMTFHAASFFFGMSLALYDYMRVGLSKNNPEPEK